MAKQSPTQKTIVARVMHEFKRGALEKSDGTPVEDRKQAIAIALHESGSSNQEDPESNRRNLARTRRRERAGATAAAQSERKGSPDETRAALYEAARRKNIPGRSRMNKSALARAVDG